MANIEMTHMELEKAAVKRAVQVLETQGVDTAWGANGLIGEKAIKLLQTEKFLISRDIQGRIRTPATRDEADLTARYIMAGMCGDWPEKYGYFLDDPRAAQVLNAA